MTREDLLGYGYIERDCKIGTLYFKENFLCSINEDGAVDFIYNFSDEVSQAIVSNLHELGLAERKYYEDQDKFYFEKARVFEFAAKIIWFQHN